MATTALTPFPSTTRRRDSSSAAPTAPPGDGLRRAKLHAARAASSSFTLDIALEHTRGAPNVSLLLTGCSAIDLKAMSTSLSPESLKRLLGQVRTAQDALVTRYPGEKGQRQPVHT